MIDISRSQGVLNPANFKDEIHVIGVGAVGSTVVDGLIRQGFLGSQIHIYDFDVVEEHNIANQMYTYHDIGKPKVEALRDRIFQEYGETINIVNDKFDVNISKSIKGVVFLLVDSFKARKQIYQSMKNKPYIKAVIETRLDARAAVCMILSPCDIDHQKYFEATLLDDGIDSSEVSACGTRQVVSQTVVILAGMAVWELIKWINNGSHIGKFTYICTDPWHIEKEEF